MARIVIVEDHLEIARLIEAILSRSHQVELFFDGLEGLAAVRAHPPDIILLDIGLPGMNGFEVAASIRSEVNLRDIPILFLTALGDIDSRLRGLELADDYLTKPFEKRELVARVEALLRRNAPSGSLKGRLELVGGASAAVQLFLLSHARGAIIFDDGTMLYFDNGRIIHVAHPDKTGLPAALDLLRRQQGGFRFDPQAIPGEQSLNADPMGLLLEVAKNSDESRRDQEPPEKLKKRPLSDLPPETVNPNDPLFTPVPSADAALVYVQMLEGYDSFEPHPGINMRDNKACVLLKGEKLTLLLLELDLKDLPDSLF